MMEHFKIFWYCMTHPPYVSCKIREWKARKILKKRLELHGYFVEDKPNPARLYAYDDDGMYCFDIIEWPDRRVTISLFRSDLYRVIPAEILYSIKSAEALSY